MAGVEALGMIRLICMYCGTVYRDERGPASHGGLNDE